MWRSIPWWVKFAMLVLVCVAAVYAVKLYSNWKEEQAAERARNALIAADPTTLARQPLRLPGGAVHNSEREQVRLTGGQFPLLVDENDRPLVSFVHYPRVDVPRSSSGALEWLFHGKSPRGFEDVVEGLIVHDPRGVEVVENVVQHVDLHRLAGHFGTFSPRGLGMNGPIGGVEFVPNSWKNGGDKMRDGSIHIYTMFQEGRVVCWQLSTGELFIVVQPAGPAKADKPKGDDDDSASDDDSSSAPQTVE